MTFPAPLLKYNFIESIDQWDIHEVVRIKDNSFCWYEVTPKSYEHLDVPIIRPFRKLEDARDYINSKIKSLPLTKGETSAPMVREEGFNE